MATEAAASSEACCDGCAGELSAAARSARAGRASRLRGPHRPAFLVAGTDRSTTKPSGCARCLTYARERSPFHARRLAGIDPSAVTIADLAHVPMMTKQQAQDEWDAIVTVPDLTRDRAEQILAEQQWFSYTPGDQQIFSSGGSSGVRGVYVWDWHFFVSIACLAWRMQAREERRAPAIGRRGSPFLRRARRRMPAHRCSTCRHRRGWKPW